jgi:hypothetical protein
MENHMDTQKKTSMKPELDTKRNDATDAPDRPDTNPDAITGAPGSHPIGTGIGASAAGIAGAALGSVVPGVGTVVGGTVGAVVGAVAGGYAGKAVAEAIDPTAEEAYWRDAYQDRDYYDPEMDYERDYAPAYRTAIEKYNAEPGARWEHSQEALEESWNNQSSSRLDWERAQRAMRDVYERDRTTGEGTRATPRSDDTISNP